MQRPPSAADRTAAGTVARPRSRFRRAHGRRSRTAVAALPRAGRDTARTVSEDNAATVRRGIEAWNRRDLKSFLAAHSPDVEFDWSRSRGPFQGVYGGRDGLEAL